MWAMGGLLLARAIYAIAILVTSLTSIEDQLLLPPLGRMVDTASIILLGWAFMPMPRRGSRTWDWVLGGSLALAVGVCLVFTILWGQASAGDAALNYNTYWQATVWAVWQLGLLVLAILGAVRSRGGGWGMFVSAMAVMTVGVLVQWFLPPQVPHLPVWQRLANLVAYPLVAVAIYQEMSVDVQERSRELEDISQASLDQIKSLLNLFDASQQTSSSLDLSTVLDNAVRGIARVLDADQCAIVFPEEGDSGTMRLVAIYNPTRQGRGEAVTFPLDYQLTVQQAIRRKKSIIVEESDNVQLKVLFALLGSGETGPLLVQPLLADRESIGAIIAGNARSRRPFTHSEAKLCQSMAGQVAAAIQNARRYEAAQHQIQALNNAQIEERRTRQKIKLRIQELTDLLAEARTRNQELRSREEEIGRTRDLLEVQLVNSRAEAGVLSSRLAELESELAQTQADAGAVSTGQEGELVRLQSETEEAVRSAEVSQAALSGMTAGVLVTDADGVIQQANKAAETLLDLDVTDLRGRRLEEISPDGRWHEAVDAASGGETIRLTVQGGTSVLICDLAPMPADTMREGEIPGLVVVLQDISTGMGEQLDRLDAVASLVEELRAPTTTIINYTDLLLSESVGTLDSAPRKFLTRIKAVAERMVQTTDALAREVDASEQRPGPQRQEVDLGKLIALTVDGSHGQLEDRALTLKLDLPESLPAVQADPEHLQHVMFNLLSNACLASSEGGQILVQATQSPAPRDQAESTVNGDGFVVVSVADSGGGLSDEALERVFDRARPSQTPPGLGESGAGLALAKTLVEAQGGRLWVESENGVGTTFSFVLPVNDLEGML
jgi:signal transduction histidine kinase